MPEIEQLIATGVRVMNEHRNDRGLCGACGATWPCQRVALAEQNLGLL
jgi:hypothetical protein